MKPLLIACLGVLFSVSAFAADTEVTANPSISSTETETSQVTLKKYKKKKKKKGQLKAKKAAAARRKKKAAAARNSESPAAIPVGDR